MAHFILEGAMAGEEISGNPLSAQFITSQLVLHYFTTCGVQASKAGGGGSYMLEVIILTVELGTERLALIAEAKLSRGASGLADMHVI